MSRQTIKESRRQQLIEANMACIARYGLTDTTIAHVSKTAAMSRGICNFYFESKEKMMQETLRFLAEEYRAALLTAVTSPEALAAVIGVHFSPRLCQPRRLAVWMAFVAHAASHVAYRKILAASTEQAAEILAGCLTGRADAPAFAANILALIQGSWVQLVLAPDATSREALLARCLAFARGNAVEAAKAPVKAPAAAKAPVAAVKPLRPVKKPAEELPQLDFGDLFAKKA